MSASTTTQNVKVVITDVTGINLQSFNAYNMTLCTFDFDSANKDYVDILKNRQFSNIGFGATFYSSIQNTFSLIKSIPTNVFTNTTNDDPTNIFLNTNMFYTSSPSRRASTTAITTGFTAGAFSFDVSVLAPNGKIYCPPIEGFVSNILIIDPITNTTTTILSNVGTFSSAILAPNGKIYCAPALSTRFLIIDPITNSIDTSTISIPGLNTTFKWHSSVITQNGTVYAIPRTDTRVLIVNTITNNYTFVNAAPTGVDKFSSSVLAPNGKIYCPPFLGFSNFLIYDINTNVADTSSLIAPVGFKYQGACCGPDGNLYFVPFTATSTSGHILRYIVSTNTLDSSTLPIATLTGGLFNYACAKLAPDGFIYICPLNQNSVVAFNPITNVINTTSMVVSGGNGKTTTGTLAQNGKIYCPPFENTRIIVVNTGIPVLNMNLCFNPIQNKGS